MGKIGRWAGAPTVAVVADAAVCAADGASAAIIKTKISLAELKALLAEARRPWWRRWMGGRDRLP
jgi:hypothetical protein